MEGFAWEFVVSSERCWLRGSTRGALWFHGIIFHCQTIRISTFLLFGNDLQIMYRRLKTRHASHDVMVFQRNVRLPSCKGRIPFNGTHKAEVMLQHEAKGVCRQIFIISTKSQSFDGLFAYFFFIIFIWLVTFLWWHGNGLLLFRPNI